MTETRRPSLRRCGMTCANSVVLPAPLHPARPMTFIDFSATEAHLLSPEKAYIGTKDLSCYAAEMMKVEKSPVPLILPDPADPRLTERVAGTDQAGGKVEI